MKQSFFIGPNNAGKSAILEAIRILLSRRWGLRGTGFTEDDVNRNDEQTDPRTAPPVKVTFEFEEDSWQLAGRHGGEPRRYNDSNGARPESNNSFHKLYLGYFERTF